MSRVKKEMVAEKSVASERNENERPRRDVCKSYLKEKGSEIACAEEDG